MALKRLRTVVISAVWCVAPSIAAAQQTAVAWKLYGSIDLGGQQVCFYDERGLVREPSGLIRVWTKCLNQHDLDVEFGPNIIEAAALKKLRKYVPPIATISGNATDDQQLDAILAETAADLGDFEASARILYEFNCPPKMMRELDIFFRTGGRAGVSHTPSQWKYVPPEGNGARLLKLVCH